MRVDTSLPDGYQPYKTLDVCSNRFVDVEVVFSVNGQPAFLIGKGATPRIWLAAPLTASRERWDYIVVGNDAITSLIQVKTVGRSHTTTIRLKETTLLTARETGPDVVKITTLDLRPVGLNIWGDSSVLYIAGNSFVNNHFERVRTAFALGGANATETATSSAQGAIDSQE